MSLLMSSEAHRNALARVLNGVSIPEGTTSETLVAATRVNSGSQEYFFHDDELPLQVKLGMESHRDVVHGEPSHLVYSSTTSPIIEELDRAAFHAIEIIQAPGREKKESGEGRYQKQQNGSLVNVKVCINPD
ncbi:hypothetical protein HAX54_005503 [Datura stramonium]|uniref:Uncharacterized protein n=1 Tax=Datura stramonium TaxID=4076 RepID=A0ABS8TA54_DATST|nr:hypothetical protein [Datura stramonium]